MDDRLPCEVSMGLMRGREIRELVEEATGQPCPCQLGRDCPLEPSVPTQRDPESRRRHPFVRSGTGTVVALVGAAALAVTGDLTPVAGFPTWSAPISAVLASLSPFVS